MQTADSLTTYLRNLSYVHEYDARFTDARQLWQPIDVNITSRWTFQAAVLYALTVITTTGSFFRFPFSPFLARDWDPA